MRTVTDLYSIKPFHRENRAAVSNSSICNNLTLCSVLEASCSHIGWMCTDGKLIKIKD